MTEPITYCIVARPFADLQEGLAAIFQAVPEVEVIIDRRIRERRRAHRPVETDRRKGVDRRLSLQAKSLALDTSGPLRGYLGPHRRRTDGTGVGIAHHRHDRWRAKHADALSAVVRCGRAF